MTELILPGGGAAEMFYGEATESATVDDFAVGSRRLREARFTGAQLKRASDLFEAALTGGTRWRGKFEEAFTTSDFDFGLAVFRNLDFEVVGQYEEMPGNWRRWCSTTSVRNFKPKTLLAFQRAKVGLDRVPEHSPYPETKRGGWDKYTIAVGKYGNRSQVTFEAWRNDEAPEQLAQIPGDLARAAVETEDMVAASNLVTAAGVNSANFGTVDTRPLTREVLEVVTEEMDARRDPVSDRPVSFGKRLLVVPPALRSQAEKAVAPVVVRTVDSATGTVTEQTNPNAGKYEVVVEPLLAYVNLTATRDTAWFILPDPTDRLNQPAVYVAFLAGYEAPELRVQNNQGTRVGGAPLTPFEGDFELDVINWRERHFVGAASANMLGAFASDGTD